MATSRWSLVGVAVLFSGSAALGSEECRASDVESCEDASFIQVRRKQMQHNTCDPSQCDDSDFVEPGLFSGNDGPVPYTMYPPDWSDDAAEVQLMGLKFKEAGLTSIRFDEAGRAFHLPCMFPVVDLNNIPDPQDDRNWNWEHADYAVKTVLEAGLAPFLKLPVLTWQSMRLTGLAHVNRTTNKTMYKIPPSPYANCVPWPSISGVIMAKAPDGQLIGTHLVLKIIARYNDYHNFPVRGKPGVGALEPGAFAKGFNGVEIFNEWNALYCFPYHDFPKGACPKNESEVVNTTTFQQYCFGPPYSWGSRYWDGTPEDAWEFYAQTAVAVKSNPQLNKVRLGGPAVLKGNWVCGKYEGVAKDWVEGFLKHVKARNATLDFFSFHMYGNEVAELDRLYSAYRGSLNATGFRDVPMVLSEYNAQFVGGNTAAYVGSVQGASMNAAKIAHMAVNWPDLKAAFVYTARTGAFEPGNPYSFPLNCKAQWTSPKPECRPKSPAFEIGSTSDDIDMASPPAYINCTPEDIEVPRAPWSDKSAPVGTWGMDCSTRNLNKNVSEVLNGSYSFGPTPYSGMGAFHPTGEPAPFGKVLQMLRSAGGSQKLQLLEPYASYLRGNGTFALAWQPRHSKNKVMLLLTNPDKTTISQDVMPTASNLLGAANVEGSITGRVLTQETLYSKETLDAAEGYDSTQPLIGTSESYTVNYGSRTVSDPLPNPGPYGVLVLEMTYSGCVCAQCPFTDA